LPLHAFTSTATAHAKALLHADTAQRTLQVFGSILSSFWPINMYYPATDCSPAAAACFIRSNIMRISVADVSPMDGTAAAHELGHYMVAQAAREAGSTRIGGTPDCSNGGNGYTKTSIEWQSCAVSEGWAEYVFAASFWSPSNMGSWPVVGDSSVGLFEFEQATPSTATLSPVQPLTNNAWMIGQAARAFWDLDDSANEAGISNCGSTNDNDVSNLASTSLMFIWQQFQSGTANRKIDEWDVANGGNQNGTNLWDVIANMPASDQAGATQTMMYHNCTETQAN
jgi:hypothetical protein